MLLKVLDYFNERKAFKGMKVLKGIWGFTKIVIIGIVIAIILNTVIIINSDITSGSMLPTLKKGDRLIGSRISYLLSEPERGDVVIFKFPDDESKLYVKRIIGLPGETIIISDGKVYICDGKELEWAYLEEDYLLDSEHTKGDFGPYLIPADSYLMLGDNRENSEDSRYWINTYVNKEQIVAKVLFKYYVKFEWIK